MDVRYSLGINVDCELQIYFQCRHLREALQFPTLYLPGAFISACNIRTELELFANPSEEDDTWSSTLSYTHFQYSDPVLHHLADFATRLSDRILLDHPEIDAMNGFDAFRQTFGSNPKHVWLSRLWELSQMQVDSREQPRMAIASYNSTLVLTLARVNFVAASYPLPFAHTSKLAPLSNPSPATVVVAASVSCDILAVAQGSRFLEFQKSTARLTLEHEAIVSCICIDQYANLVCVGDISGHVTLWNGFDGSLARKIECPFPVHQLVVTPTYLVAQGSNLSTYIVSRFTYAAALERELPFQLINGAMVAPADNMWHHLERGALVSSYIADNFVRPSEPRTGPNLQILYVVPAGPDAYVVTPNGGVLKNGDQLFFGEKYTCCRCFQCYMYPGHAAEFSHYRAEPIDISAVNNDTVVVNTVVRAVKGFSVTRIDKIHNGIRSFAFQQGVASIKQHHANTGKPSDSNAKNLRLDEAAAAMGVEVADPLKTNTSYLSMLAACYTPFLPISIIFNSRAFYAPGIHPKTGALEETEPPHFEIDPSVPLSTLAVSVKARKESRTCLLLHSPNGDLDAILNTGLDPRYSKIGSFGRGVYFTDCMEKASSYFRPEWGVKLSPLCPEDKYVFVCSVALGKTFSYAPMKKNAGLYCAPPGYDSVMGFIANSKEFVVYDAKQVFIEYLVHYKQIPTASVALQPHPPAPQPLAPQPASVPSSNIVYIPGSLKTFFNELIQRCANDSPERGAVARRMIGQLLRKVIDLPEFMRQCKLLLGTDPPDGLEESIRVRLEHISDKPSQPPPPPPPPTTRMILPASVPPVPSTDSTASMAPVHKVYIQSSLKNFFDELVKRAQAKGENQEKLIKIRITNLLTGNISPRLFLSDCVYVLGVPAPDGLEQNLTEQLKRVRFPTKEDQQREEEEEKKKADAKPPQRMLLPAVEPCISSDSEEEMPNEITPGSLTAPVSLCRYFKALLVCAFDVSQHRDIFTQISLFIKTGDADAFVNALCSILDRRAPENLVETLVYWHTLIHQ